MTKSEHLVRAALARNHIAITGAFRPPRRKHAVVKDVTHIKYTPESATEAMLKMLRSYQDVLKLLVFRDTLRPDALQREADK